MLKETNSLSLTLTLTLTHDTLSLFSLLSSLHLSNFFAFLFTDLFCVNICICCDQSTDTLTVPSLSCKVERSLSTLSVYTTHTHTHTHISSPITWHYDTKHTLWIRHKIHSVAMKSGKIQSVLFVSKHNFSLSFPPSLPLSLSLSFSLFPSLSSQTFK